MLTEKIDEDTVSAYVLRQLSDTVYACSSLSQLSSRPGNFVYRGVLVHPFLVQDEVAIRTVIIKHSVNFENANVTKHIECCNFEELLLNVIPQPLIRTDTTTMVKTPRLYILKRESNIQILEDFVTTNGLKSVLVSSEANDVLPSCHLVSLGRALGSWLRALHEWAAAPDQANVRAQIWQNDPMRKTKYLYTYHGFLNVLEEYPELLKGHRQILEIVRDTIAKEYEKSSAEEDENFGLIHGDFWSGNILLPDSPWREPPLSSEPNKLFIIDWEFAQFGHRSNDLGQIIGDLYERKLYYNADTATSVIEGIIKGYGKLSEQMAFRVAVYVGVHLIRWHNRRPQRGPKVVPPDAILAGLTIGRDFIVKGWEMDKKFFENSALALLFTIM
ncbi:kinase-like domain-containing protein [Trichoderma chlorosporum]